MGHPLHKIVYVGDPLCSWCWGIAEELEMLRNAWQGKAEFQIVLGGLRPGGTETIGGKMGHFLARHWSQVSRLSGQPISHGMLENKNFIYDTEPPCRAIRVVRALDSRKEFAFFKAVQYAFYVRNRDTNELKTYLEICSDLSLDKNSFEERYKNKTLKLATQVDFNLARSMGVTSFPTVLLQLGSEIHVLARGYAKFADMDKELQETLSMYS